MKISKVLAVLALLVLVTTGSRRLISQGASTSPGVEIGVPQYTVDMSSIGSATIGIFANPTNGVKVAATGQGCGGAIASGLPAGVTAAWSQPKVSSVGQVEWQLVLSGSPLAVASDKPVTLTVHVKDAKTGSIFNATGVFYLNVAFTAPTLSLSPVQTHVFLRQGSAVSDTFSLTGGGSFHGSVTLSISGLPSGLAANWSQNPVSMNANKGTSLLRLTASPGIAAKGYSFVVTATGDGLNLSKSYNATIEPVTGVALGVTQLVARVNAGETTSLSVTAQGVNGVTIPSNGSGVQAAITSPMPDGVTAKWTQSPLTSNNTVTWTVDLSADPSAMSGTYPLTISGSVTDSASGLVFSASRQASLLVSLLANVTIGTTPGVSIPTEFMGLSHEWGNTNRFMGNSVIGVNTGYRQLLLNLTAYGSSPVHLRIGGNSTDLTGAPSGDPVLSFAELSKAMKNRFILGVNLGSDNTSLAVAQTQSYVSQMPAGSIDALEIGNEPDLYHLNGLRPSTYTFEDYLNDFNTWTSYISPQLPSGTKLAGPAWASMAMLPNLPTFESREGESISTVTQHFYATTPNAHPADDFLLTEGAASNAAKTVAVAVTQSHANGLRLRIGEFNSIDDAGVAGISDAFASALWAVDAMFEFANVGVDGVNWETSSGNADHPFYFTTTTNNGVNTYTLASVSPLYYGMLFFQAATAKQSRLLPVVVDTSANVKCWATLDSNQTQRLTILNKDELQSGPVSISLPGYSKASILRLTAPNYTSTSGVMFGGQTFDSSTDGTIKGTQTIETVEAKDGIFEIDMPVTSAALVVFSK